MQIREAIEPATRIIILSDVLPDYLAFYQNRLPGDRACPHAHTMCGSGRLKEITRIR